MAFNPKDEYFKKAKKEGYAARSAYKLMEIQQKHRVIKKGAVILDLGCSPGSWSQYASKEAGKNGFILGIDLKPPADLKLANAKFITEDIYKITSEDLTLCLIEAGVKSEKFDVVISDMAPATTGIAITDQSRSLDLCEMALHISHSCLKLGGNLIMKNFEGPDSQEFIKKCRTAFKKVALLRPKGTRKASKEIFVICIDFIN